MPVLSTSEQRKACGTSYRLDGAMDPGVNDPRYPRECCLHFRRAIMYWSISYPAKCVRLATFRSRERGVLHMSPTIQAQLGWILKPELQAIPHSVAQSLGPGGFNVDMVSRLLKRRDERLGWEEQYKEGPREKKGKRERSRSAWCLLSDAKQCCFVWDHSGLWDLPAAELQAQHRGAPCWPQLLYRALHCTGHRRAGCSSEYTCLELISPAQ